MSPPRHTFVKTPVGTKSRRARTAEGSRDRGSNVYRKSGRDAVNESCTVDNREGTATNK